MRRWTEKERAIASKQMSSRMLGNIPYNKLNKDIVQDRLNTSFPNQFIVNKYNNQNDMEVTCLKCNKTYKAYLHRLTLYGCKKCEILSKKPRNNTWNKISKEDFADRFNIYVKDKYELLSDYISAADYIRVRCIKCNHIWDVKARQFMRGSGCPICAKTSSKQELQVCNYIKSIYDGEVIQNDRTILKPKELDIYIPDKNLAIEYNGTFWHSDIYKDANYHYDKSVLCEEHGIRLIHIWEYEWNNERQRPILENIIKGALGLNETIYARKCNIVIRQSKDMTEFFNKNNIQGFRGGKFAVCLEYNNEIVMSYIFGSAFFGKGKYEYEVIRGATKLGYNVVGGASRIWKYFINEYKPKSCVYYVDYNYFNGSSLLNLEGMKFIKTQKSYKNYWIEDDTVRNRDPIHNAEINKLYKEGLVIKLYNAGTKLYVWTNDEN